MRNYESRLKRLEARRPADQEPARIVSWRTPKAERERIETEWQRDGEEVKRITFTPAIK